MPAHWIHIHTHSLLEQEDAFRDVVLSDSSESSGFVARFRRRAAPTFDSVVEKFNKSLAARDSALLETRGLKESDVDYALRYYCNDAAVRAAEAAVLATAPLAAAAHPVVSVCLRTTPLDKRTEVSP